MPPTVRARRAASGFGRLARVEPLIFSLIILLHLIPIWSVRYLPTTDGAAHVANADVLRQYNHPDRAVFRKYYRISHEPSPNLAGHLILAALLTIAPPTVAEKILISLYLVLFPLAVRYAVRGIHRQSAPLAYLSFPLLYSFLLHQGFYNFCLSIAGFFLLVGYQVRSRERLSLWRTMALAALALLLYTCHLFSLLMACGVLGALEGWRWGREAWQSRRFFGPAARSALRTAAALAPGLLLAVMFRPSPDHGALPPHQAWSLGQLKDDLVSLIEISPLTSFRRAEQWLGGAVFALFMALLGVALIAKFRRRFWRGWDVLLLVSLALAAVFLTANDPASTYFYIPQRALFYAFLVLILALSAQPMTRQARWLAMPLSIALGLGFAASAALKYREFAPQIREFVEVAGRQIAPGSTFLPLIYSPQGRDDSGSPGSIDVAPFYMISGYIAAGRDAVDLRNYEAKTDHFPVRFRPQLNPYQHLAIGRGLDQIPPRIDIANFRRQGGEVDYVLIWGMPPEMREEQGTVALHEQLRSAGYEEAPLAGAKRTELWRRIAPAGGP